MIESGIREKEKDVRNWSPYGGVSWIQQTSNNLVTNSMNKDYKSEEVSSIISKEKNPSDLVLLREIPRYFSMGPHPDEYFRK